MILMDWRCPFCNVKDVDCYPAVEHISMMLYFSLRRLTHVCQHCKKESRMSDVEKTSLGFEVRYEGLVHEEVH